MKCKFSYGKSYIPLAIYQIRAVDAHISWLFQAHLEYYLHGQKFLALQHRTFALLAAQQLMGKLSGGMRRERRQAAVRLEALLGA